MTVRHCLLNMEASRFITVLVLSMAFVMLASAASQHQGLRERRRLIKFVECDFNTTKGAVCLDCNLRLICTPFGGLEIPCFIPGRQNCVEGNCMKEPSEQCKAEEPAPEPQPELKMEEIPDLTVEPVPEQKPKLKMEERLN